MKIHDRVGAPNTARVRIVVAEKGLESRIQYVSVDLISAEQKSPAFLALNPLGKIQIGRAHV